MLRVIDIHSHLNFPQFDGDREEIISRMKEEGIGTITIGTNLETSKEAILLAEAHDNLWAGIGMHPTDDLSDFDPEEFMKLALHPRVVCIGECGLDYFRLSDNEEDIKERQKEIFIKHIEIAEKAGKPLMIHGRPSQGSMDAYEDILYILEKYSGLKVNFHFFVGDLIIAERIVKNGWTMSFDGPITFSNDYDNVIKSIPIESIMVETDAPFAAPMPYRGKRNEPLYVIRILERIAELREKNLEDVMEKIRENTQKIFGI